MKIDLHTHSTASPDGGINEAGYRHLLDSGTLDYIAITDHNTISLAQSLHESLGDQIIIGEEIMTSSGEIIGLFLKGAVQPQQSPADTCRAIHDQGGLVYIPHPFESIRKGLDVSTLNTIASYIDIMEVHNGRAFFDNQGPKAVAWARLQHVAEAASSDAHGLKGAGGCYTEINGAPSATTLVSQLATARLHITKPPFLSLLYPKMHRLRKVLHL